VLAPGEFDVDRRLRLPAPLAAVLRAAKGAEEVAVGGHRRAAFQLTRRIIGGLVEDGYPLQLVAVELGLRAESVRTRIQAGPIAFADIAALTGIAAQELKRRAAGLSLTAEDGQVHSAHLGALLLEPPGAVADDPPRKIPKSRHDPAAPPSLLMVRDPNACHGHRPNRCSASATRTPGSGTPEARPTPWASAPAADAPGAHPGISSA
jgi:hypothetical protein